MPTIAPEAFQRLSAEKKAGTPVLVLAGDEQFFKDEARDALEAALGRPERIEKRLSGGARAGQDLSPILDELRTGSLFSSRKVLLVRDAEAFLAGAAEAIVGHAKRGAQGGAAGTALVLEVTSLDKRTKAAKEVEAAAIVVDCKRLYSDPPPWVKNASPADSPLVQWALARARAVGLAATPQIAHALVQETGNDLHEIAATLEKVRLSGAKTLGLAEVEALAAKSKKDDAFALAEAVGKRDLARALAISARLFERGMVDRKGGRIGDAGTIGNIAVGRIYASMQEVRRTIAHLRAGGARTRDAVAAAVGVAPFVAERALGNADRWREVDLGALWPFLLEADLGIKGAVPSGGAREVVEKLCVSLLHPVGRAANIRPMPEY